MVNVLLPHLICRARHIPWTRFSLPHFMLCACFMLCPMCTSIYPVLENGMVSVCAAFVSWKIFLLIFRSDFESTARRDISIFTPIDLILWLFQFFLPRLFIFYVVVSVWWLSIWNGIPNIHFVSKLFFFFSTLTMEKHIEWILLRKWHW